MFVYLSLKVARWEKCSFLYISSHVNIKKLSVSTFIYLPIIIPKKIN